MRKRTTKTADKAKAEAGTATPSTPNHTATPSKAGRHKRVGPPVKSTTGRRVIHGMIDAHNGKWRIRWRSAGVAHAVTTKWEATPKTWAKADAERASLVYPYNLATVAETKASLAEDYGKTKAELDAERFKQVLPLADAWRIFMDSGHVLKSGGRKTIDGGFQTTKRYRAKLDAFAEWAAGQGVGNVEAVTLDVAERFINEGLKGSANGTVNKYLGLLRHTWDVLMEKAGTLSNPWRRIEKLENTSSTRRDLTPDELAAVYAKTSGEMRLLFAIGLHTGMRLGDAVTLKWEAVDLDGGRLIFTPHKTIRHNPAPIKIKLHAALASALAEIPPEERHGYIMPKLARRYIDDNADLSAHIQAVFKSAGIETRQKLEYQTRAAVAVGFHSLRHTFVSIAANNHVSLETVQAIVGHSSPQMTEHYNHVKQNSMDEAVDRIPAIGPTAPALLPAANPAATVPALDALRAFAAKMTPAELAEGVKILKQASRKRTAGTAKPKATDTKEGTR